MGVESRLTETTRPDYLPESFWDADAGAAKADDLKAVFESHAAAEARKAALPKDATGYKFGTPKDFQLPQGWKLDDKHPLVEPYRAFAVANGFTQEQFEAGVQMFGQYMVADDAQYRAFQADQRKKLGANGENRITALKTFLGGIVGAQGAQRIVDMAVMVPDVEIFEKLMTAVTSQGGSTYQNGGREPPPPPPVPIEKKLWPKRQGVA